MPESAERLTAIRRLLGETAGADPEPRRIIIMTTRAHNDGTFQRLTFFWAALAIVLLTATTALSEEVRSTHGDWQVRCESPPGAQTEQCYLMQSVTAEDREEVGLVVYAIRLADGEGSLLRIVAPLGVLLPTNLGLRIDEEDIGNVPFMRCLPNGCIADADLDSELIGQLSDGEEALFIVFQTPEEGIGIPMSLAGFAEGYEALP
jgi:invasion protein IalB